jgi:ribosomal-protein-alanine N-acetyltransferase
VTDRIGVSLRQVQPGDVRALAAAERGCFEDPWPEPYFLSELLAPARFHRLLINADGTLAAYLFTAWQYLDLHILKVATLPAYRGRGLARRLMQIAEEHALEMAGESLTLEVRRRNTPAIAMYLSLGYQHVGVRPRYYADGSDALVMTKRVGGG